MKVRLDILIAATLLVALAADVAIPFAHQRRLRAAAEAGLRHEVSENSEGVEEMRQAIPEEVKNISVVISLLKKKEANQTTDGAKGNLGLAVMAFTDANWQAATETGAVRSMNYDKVQRYSGAYFEQARLAQLQTSTLESMMALSSYIGHGEKISFMSPQLAGAAEIQAQALLAHLGMMSRMSDGVKGAYQAALGS